MSSAIASFVGESIDYSLMDSDTHGALKVTLVACMPQIVTYVF